MELQELLKEFAGEVHMTACEKGFWDNPKSDVECVALMITELAEAIEAIRNGNPQDTHVPEMNNLDIELADCVIRILDFCAWKNIDLGLAMIAKNYANTKRSKMHGGKIL